MSKIQEIPDFSVNDYEGQPISKESLIGKPSVIYFYPKNFTAGCTAEACSFRDAFEDFKNIEATVVGISLDNDESHKKFAEKYRLPFRLVSDPKKKLQKLFGVKADLFGLIPGRETFTFDRNGKLIHHFKSQMKVEKHVAEAIGAIKESEGTT